MIEDIEENVEDLLNQLEETRVEANSLQLYKDKEISFGKFK